MQDLYDRLAWLATHRRDVRAMVVIELCAKAVGRRLANESLVVHAVVDRLATPLRRGEGLAAWHRGLIEGAEAVAGRTLPDASADARELALLSRALRDVPVLRAGPPAHARARRLARLRSVIG